MTESPFPGNRVMEWRQTLCGTDEFAFREFTDGMPGEKM